MLCIDPTVKHGGGWMGINNGGCFALDQLHSSRDVLHPLVCITEGKDSYFSRIMSPNTPQYFEKLLQDQSRPRRLFLHLALNGSV